MLKIKTMKKQIFTLLFMLALVTVTSNVFAQNTAVAPYEGSEHTYQVDGIAVGSTYQFYVNQSSTFSATNSGLATITSGGNGTITAAASNASVQVSFGTGSASAGYYYIWINVIDASGCSVPRALRVDPVPAATYDVTYGVLALRTGDATTTGSDITTAVTNAMNDGSANQTDCPAFVGADQVYETVASPSSEVSDGSSYTYFSITRTSTDVPNTVWAISTTTTNGSNWVYSTDPSFATSSALTATISNITENVIYVRAQLTNSSSSSQTATLAISGGDDTLMSLETTSHNASSATLTVSPVPAVGGFSLSN